jgi:GMP reductase
MRLESELKLDFDDVLIKPKRSKLKSRRDVNLMKKYTFLHSKKQWEGIPIMASNMDTVGVFEMANVLQKHNMMTVMNKFCTVEQWVEQKDLNHNLTIPSIGTSDKELERFTEVCKVLTDKPQFLCIDVANGYGEYLIEFVKKVRSTFPDITLISGNVVSAEMTEALILSGVDIVKIGIGSGAACTTRLKTGCGSPQFSAVIECADAAHGLGGLVISDGGCKTPGDVAKAFAAGADFVMLGGMLAGHDESAGELIVKRYLTNELDENDKQIVVEKKFKEFYGMSSGTAQQKYDGEQKSYRASEGRTLKVPYKGPVENTLQEILGGLRSTCTYVGASCLKHLPKCATFNRVNNTHNRVFERFEN